MSEMAYFEEEENPFEKTYGRNANKEDMGSTTPPSILSTSPITYPEIDFTQHPALVEFYPHAQPGYQSPPRLPYNPVTQVPTRPFSMMSTSTPPTMFVPEFNETAPNPFNKPQPSNLTPGHFTNNSGVKKEEYPTLNIEHDADIEAGDLGREIQLAAAEDGFILRMPGDPVPKVNPEQEVEGTLSVVCTFFAQTVVGQVLLGISLSGAGVYVVKGCLQYVVNTYALPRFLDAAIRGLLNVNMTAIGRVLENLRNQRRQTPSQDQTPMSSRVEGGNSPPPGATSFPGLAARAPTPVAYYEASERPTNTSTPRASRTPHKNLIPIVKSLEKSISAPMVSNKKNISLPPGNTQRKIVSFEEKAGQTIAQIHPPPSAPPVESKPPVTPALTKIQRRVKTPWPTAEGMNCSAGSLWSTEAVHGSGVSRSLPIATTSSTRITPGRGRGRGTPTSGTSLEAQKLRSCPGFNLGSPVNMGRGARVVWKDGRVRSMRFNPSTAGPPGVRNLNQQFADASAQTPAEGEVAVEAANVVPDGAQARPNSPTPAGKVVLQEETVTTDEENSD